MNMVSGTYYSLPSRDVAPRQIAELIETSQADGFFHLAHAKETRVKALRAHFATNKVRKIWFSNNLGGFAFTMPGVETGVLEKGFFSEHELHNNEAKKAMLADCIVIMNNNDLASEVQPNPFSLFYGACESTVFIAWDWDNHHWLDLSTFLAAHSDIYAPSHHENLYLLTRYNWLTAGPVYCATVQWPRSFLASKLGAMLSTDRSNDPLGKHIPYGQFAFRMRVVSTLSQTIPSIGFSDRSFHDRTRDDRVQEWYSHKLHWIVPVLNDVPIRIFDALATGGIPVVPESMRLLPCVADIPRQHILFYSPLDIIDPTSLIARGVAMFDAGGQEQIAARHRYAMEHHHGDTRVHQMLGAVREVLGIELPGA